MPADAAQRCYVIRKSPVADPIERAIAALAYRERRQRELDELGRMVAERIARANPAR